MHSLKRKRNELTTSEILQSPAKDLVGSYFIRLWHQKRAPEEGEELRTELDTVTSSGGFSVVGPDKLSMSYPIVDSLGFQAGYAGVVLANKPAPSKRLLYYFEIRVKNAGKKGNIDIGFTTSDFQHRRQPGREANSCGYHGADGRLYRGNGKGETFGPTYTTGDTVGGGINYASQEIFFTKNGVLVGSVLKDIKGPVFATVCVSSRNEEVTVNFGKEPYIFDLEAYEAEHRAKEKLEIDSISLSHDPSYEIVRSYLQHYGYEETLNMLDKETLNMLDKETLSMLEEETLIRLDIDGKSTTTAISVVPETCFNDEGSMYALNQRRTLRQLIRRGEIDDTFSKIREWYPQIVQDETSTVCFLLHCQKFIELVRVVKLEEAIWFGRNEFSKFMKLSEYVDLVKDCASLLAYVQPDNSFVGYLLKNLKGSCWLMQLMLRFYVLIPI